VRIQHISIGRWRHFQDVELSVPDGAPVVCLIGGNGTGKSQILELIAACASISDCLQALSPLEATRSVRTRLLS
jgi:predicted ATP-binding protein involved in virulence